MIKRIVKYSGPALLMALGSFSVAQTPVKMAPAQSSDLVPMELVRTASVGKVSQIATQEPITFSWALEQDKAINLKAEAHVASSRQYVMEVSAADLNMGVTLPVTETGALVRINPKADTLNKAHRLALDPLDLVLVNSENRSFEKGQGMKQIAAAETLKKAGSPFAAGTAAFQIREEVGVGSLVLHTEALGASERDSYFIHVFDKHSDVELSLRTLNPNYLYGQELVIEASLSESGKVMKADIVEGFVKSPAGQVFEVTFERSATGSYAARMPLEEASGSVDGLWEVSASVSGDIRRDARTSFAYGLPTARFTGEIEKASAKRSSDKVSFELGVEVASTGRYEVRGILYGSDTKGQLKPFAIGHSAAVLAEGDRAIRLEFYREFIRESGLVAPFAVKDLRLVNQGERTLIHRQENGFTLESL